MEKIKMYAVKWRGKVSECEYEVANTLQKIVEVCAQTHDCDTYTTYSVDKVRGCKEIEISIVAINEETARAMTEWMEEFAGIKMEVKEIEISPLPFEN